MHLQFTDSTEERQTVCKYFDNCVHLKPLEFSRTLARELPPFLQFISKNRFASINTL